MEYTTVLGATGLLGKAVTDNLLKRGFNVKILVRDIEKYKEMYVDGKLPGRVDVIEGELDSNIALANVLEYSDTVFVCYNAPYKNWITNLPRWTAKIGDLSAALQARIIYPGCIINYGPNSPKLINEETDQSSTAEKGQLKIALEQRLGTSSIKGATLTVVRIPELYGPTDNRQVISELFTSAVRGKRASWYGNPQIKHEFLYSEDAADAMIEIALNENTKDSMIHLSGHRVTADDFIKLIYDNASILENPPYKVTNKIVSGVKSIFSKEQTEINELNYFYNKELFLDNTKYTELVGNQQLSDLKDSIRKTYEWFEYWYKE